VTFFYILLGNILLVVSVGKIVTSLFEIKLIHRKEKLLNRELDFNLIREMDVDGNGIDRFEFVFGVLTQLG
jgi:hypothetical protein